MPLDKAKASQFLKEFNFKKLFTEVLGWDHLTQHLELKIDGKTYRLSAIAHKRGMVAFECPSSDCQIPSYPIRRKIDQQVTKTVREHIIIYTDPERTLQIWQWVKREAGKPTACREHHFHRNQSGEALIQKLDAIKFTLEEEEQLNIVEVQRRARKGFDVETVTKKFYDRFKTEHDGFLKFIKGIPDDEFHRWYASVMLNRLMFIYFIQKKGFLDNNVDYLLVKLGQAKERGKDKFYTEFLCPLFFEGFAKKEADRSASMNKLLGKVPYLNGGLFLKHQIEEQYGKEIRIADAAFEKIFAFFEQYRWHLDERPLKEGNEINPDVLGYIFEKYINQKQMGAYYTKEDITEYISKSTVIPYLFDAAKQKCKIAFEVPSSSHSRPDRESGSKTISPIEAFGDDSSTATLSSHSRGFNRESGVALDSTIWKLLQIDPDRYIYDAVKKGVELPLPEEIAKGLNDISTRTEWNKPAPTDYALPTEIWREVVARRKRCEEVRAKLANGEIRDINDFITYNLNIRQFAQDVIENSEGPELLRAFYHAIEKVTVLDPTCGSGAFLFAALNILEPLYEACLDRMEVFLSELERSGEKHRPEKYSDFKKILEQIEKHPNRKYFIFKSIIVNNLYGVDIMEEAIEICKLRLFLKLVAQVGDAVKIEPLPDIDFNIRAGNTLVGYATYDEVKHAVTSKLDFDNAMAKIEEQAQDIDRLFKLFHQQQTEIGGEVTPESKQELSKRLKKLDDELNHHLAIEYGIDLKKKTAFEIWLKSHQPFHWFIEFYGIRKNGGFDVIIGNPPYLDFKDLEGYQVKGFATITTRNLYPLILERCQYLVSTTGHQGYIVPVSSVATEGYSELQKLLIGRELFYSSFDDRPAHLFEGLDKNTLSILLMSKTKKDINGYSTRLSRWNAEERESLFSLLRYHSTTQCRMAGCLPKLGTSIEASIWQKMFNRDKSLLSSYVKSSKHVVYYSRKVNAFLQILDFVPIVRDGRGKTRPPSEFKELHLSSKEAAAAVFCCFNSTLFRWFMDVVSDGSHVNRREVDGFPFDPTRANSNFMQIAKRLSKNLQETSLTRTMRYQHDTLTVQCIIPKNSKSIIDEIDRVLAKHYGFTDEELDFIINYDIKYRMGRDGEEAD